MRATLRPIGFSRQDASTWAPLLMLLGMMGLSFFDNLVREVSQALSVWQFHVLRSLVVLAIMAVVLRWRGEFKQLKLARAAMVFWRTTFLIVSMIIYYGCLAFLPISQVAAGLFTSPIFVMIFSVIIGQPVGWRRWSAAGLGFVGMLSVLDIGQGGFELLSVIPVLAGALYAVSVLLTRLGCSEESPVALSVATYVGYLMVTALGLLALSFVPLDAPWRQQWLFIGLPWQSLALWIWGLIVVMAVGSLLSVYAITRAYQMAAPAAIAPYEYSFLVFASLWSYVLWQEVPSHTTLVGGALIIVSGILIGFFEYQNRQRVKSLAD